MSSPREREKRDRRESRGDEREGQGRKRNRNESEETEEIKTFPSTLTHYKDSRPCPTVSQYPIFYVSFLPLPLSDIYLFFFMYILLPENRLSYFLLIAA